ncbi:hypothetical protein PFDSM3638_06035 [Pyrococcus furiosus DSM 3638]|uniref:PIN domain-containing protein n=2 Tax=Pyrococcus furiosus (strain ATCC 43587 / DSM 3638 / JCM 8422 / Vc1) TaxID=186497 RepID=Q8U1K0_PYRFU|nr:type II toxin-antitoxin system VapC family toxin [Pyrococcus furiosus]AAL81330.1 hypothetical protein PF1206 [Pyrococcus furiosus DSM 3638]QEK78857.1 hypothetical protein PFDSM3638_06035 [Pyrococcus furiosus DSM 3638]
MNPMPRKISFDPPSFIQLTRKQNKELLEFVLAEFEIYLPITTVHAYLLAKAFKGKNPKEEVQKLRDIVKIVDLTDELLGEIAEIDASLIKDGYFFTLEDLITAVSAITSKSLLVVNGNAEKYSPLRKYGLDCVNYEKFLEEVEVLAREEAKREKII